MLVADILYLIIGALVEIFFGLFAANSLKEKKSRATIISFVLLLAIGLFWFGGYFIFELSSLYMLAVTGIMGLVSLLFFAPAGKSAPMRIGEITERVDERDVLFSREEYRPGSDKYEQYYARHPEHKKVDDRLHKLPELLEPGGCYYDPTRSVAIDKTFGRIRRLTTAVDGPINSDKNDIDPKTITDEIKRTTLRLGADEVGVARLDPMFVYSHVGRGPEEWGRPITNHHKFAVVFELEMDYYFVDDAPRLSITEETARKYLQVAEISIKLAEYIRALGYPARAHIAGSNYQIMLPPVAYDAGLGEIGRMGYLVSPKFGGRIRLGAVTTDLPLIADRPINFGLQDFCEKCLKCAVNCPSGAIPSGATVNIRGAWKWSLNTEQCLHYWRVIGTDCGLCMKVCPFSHPENLVHNLIRIGIKNSSVARQLSLWGDDIFYGKKTKFQAL
jgi:reductive dehalogenase